MVGVNDVVVVANTGLLHFLQNEMFIMFVVIVVVSLVMMNSFFSRSKQQVQQLEKKLQQTEMELHILKKSLSTQPTQQQHKQDTTERNADNNNNNSHGTNVSMNDNHQVEVSPAHHNHEPQQYDHNNEIEEVDGRIETINKRIMSPMKTKQQHQSQPQHEEIRIFMDGAFDLLHFGHVNAFRLARSLGTKLIVGVNSDESITVCKGPPLMNNEQRITMVQQCKFVDEIIPNCPYIMNHEYIQYVIQTYNISYVIHGDDPCIVNGQDVYAAAKAAGKFRTIPRTMGVSTTDIVGRMLLLTKEHHYHNNNNSTGTNNNTSSTETVNQDDHHKDDTEEEDDEDVENDDSIDEEKTVVVRCKPRSSSLDDNVLSSTTTTLRRRKPINITSSSSSVTPSTTSTYHPYDPTKSSSTYGGTSSGSSGGGVGQTQSRFLTTSRMLQLFSSDLQAPLPSMKIIYIDGAWDLFHPGHVHMLQKARERGDYLLVGVHGDALVNQIQGMNLPLMNLHERVLSVLGCRYVSDVLIDAPLIITPDMIKAFNISEVVRGTPIQHTTVSTTTTTTSSVTTNTTPVTPPTSNTMLYDNSHYNYETIRYKHVKELGIFRTIPYPTNFRITSVIQRIQKNQELFQTKFERKMELELQYTKNIFL